MRGGLGFWGFFGWRVGLLLSLVGVGGVVAGFV